MHNVPHSNLGRPEYFFHRARIVTVIVGYLFKFVTFDCRVELLILSKFNIIGGWCLWSMSGRHEWAILGLCFTFTQLMLQIGHFFFHSLIDSFSRQWPDFDLLFVSNLLSSGEEMKNNGRQWWQENLKTPHPRWLHWRKLGEAYFIATRLRCYTLKVIQLITIHCIAKENSRQEAKDNDDKSPKWRKLFFQYNVFPPIQMATIEINTKKRFLDLLSSPAGNHNFLSNHFWNYLSLTTTPIFYYDEETFKCELQSIKWKNVMDSDDWVHCQV